MRLLLPAVVLLAGAAAFGTGTGAALDDDSRLQTTFTASYLATPLKDLLADFSRRTGVSITAARSVADDFVILCVRDKTYAQVMHKLAGHFGFAWVTDSRGGIPRYRLCQTAAAARKEAELRLAQESGLFSDLRKSVEADAKLRPEDIADMGKRYIEYRRAAPPYPDRGGPWSAREDQMSPEMRAWRDWTRRPESQIPDRLRPDRQVVAKFLLTLQPRHWSELLADERLVFCTIPVRFEEPLAQDWLPKVREWVSRCKARRAQPKAEPFDLHEVSITGLEMPWMFWISDAGKAQDTSDPEAVRAVALVLHYTRAARVNASIQNGNLSVTLIAMGEDRRPLAYADFSFRDPAFPRPTTWRVAGEDAKAVPPAKDYASDAVLGRPVPLTASLDELMKRCDSSHSSLSWVTKFHWAGEPLNVVEGPLRLAIAEAAGVSLIADAFDTEVDPYQDPARSVRPKVNTVGNYLDQLDWRCDQAWGYRDGWIALRTRDWAYRRPRQMPRKTLQRLWELADGTVEMPLDDVAKLCASATELQWSGCPYSLQGLDSGALVWLRGATTRALLRIWSGLSPSEREVLRQGRSIPVTAMTPAQQADLMRVLRTYEPTYGPGSENDTLELFGEKVTKRQEELLKPYAMPVRPVTWPEWLVGPDAIAEARALVEHYEEPAPSVVWRARPPAMTPALSTSMVQEPAFYEKLWGEKPFGSASVSMWPEMLGEQLDWIQQQHRDQGVAPSIGRQVITTSVFRVHLANGRLILPFLISDQRAVPNSEFSADHPPDDVLKLVEDAKSRKKGSP